MSCWIEQIGQTLPQKQKYQYVVLSNRIELRIFHMVL